MGRDTLSDLLGAVRLRAAVFFYVSCWPDSAIVRSVEHWRCCTPPPAHGWTIDELGRQVGLSRSALHERFVPFLGQPPMHYLASWRIQLGSRLLRETCLTVAAVAPTGTAIAELAASAARGSITP